MDKREDLKIIQSKEKSILEEFIKICDKYELRYFLVEGSMLGAVRHQGMIPWDDDIDVALFRNDHERFLSIAKTELSYPYKCQSFILDKDRKDYLTQIVDESTIVETQFRSSIQKSPVWIDLFVIDGMPGNRLMRALHYYHLLYRKMMLMWSDIDYFVVKRNNRPFHERVLIKIAKVFHTGFFISTRKQLYKMDKCMKKYPVKDGKNVINFMSEYKGKSEFPYDFFGKGRKSKFDELTARIPKNAEKILSNIYGNYMELPPEDKRYKHSMKLIKIQRGN